MQTGTAIYDLTFEPEIESYKNKSSLRAYGIFHSILQFYSLT